MSAAAGACIRLVPFRSKASLWFVIVSLSFLSSLSGLGFVCLV